jgi:putative ABC transport system permease protein
MSTWMREIRYAIRRLRAQRVFALTAIGTLALATGAMSTMFLFADAVLWRPLPYDVAGRLVALFEHDLDRGQGRNPTSPANFRDWMAGGPFEDMTAAHPWSAILSTSSTASEPGAGSGHGMAVKIDGLKATPSLFRLLGATPLIGRVFTPEDFAAVPDSRTAGEAGKAGDSRVASPAIAATPAADPRVVVLGYRLWQRQFGGDRGVVNRVVSLNGEPYTIIGVMPDGFAFPPFWATGTEYWVPLVFAPNEAGSRGARMLRVFGRLNTGVSIERARATMNTLAARLEHDYPDDNRRMGITVEPLLEPTISGVRRLVLLAFGAAGFVLVMACTNIVGLLLTRSAERAGDLGVRLALGATRFDLLREWVSDGLVLAAAGGLAGALVSVWSRGVWLLIAPDRFPRLAEMSGAIDLRGIGFAMAITAAIGLALGLAPAVLSSRAQVVDLLRGRSARLTSHSSRLRAALIVGQLTLAVTLLVGAGLMLRSLWYLQTRDPGFSRDGVLTLTVMLPRDPYRDAAQQRRFLDETTAAVQQIAGVQRAGFVNHLPVAGDLWSSGLTFEGVMPDSDRPAAAGSGGAGRGRLPVASFRAVTPGLFDALGIRRTAGRDFTSADTATAAPVVIVNEALVRRYLSGRDSSGRDRDPIGQRVVMGAGPSADTPWMTIVGVVRNVAQQSLEDEPEPEMYFPYAQNPVSWFLSTTLVVHTSGDPMSLRRGVERAIAGVEPGAPIERVQTMGDVLAGAVGQPRFHSALLGAFAVTALILAMLGLYGVISHSVTTRTREMGVRMALGADRGVVVGQILREGVWLAAIGTLAGLACALALSRLLATSIHGVTTLDPLTYAGVAGLLITIALAACLVPAIRASRLDPVRALHAD